jgi:uncharacterized membrane protein YraQ (UPF0718 family)
VALGLKRAGSSSGAALAFWLGNPILNPATMIFMGFVLGWQWVGLRIVAGLLLVFGVAHFAQFFVNRNSTLPEGLLHHAASGENREPSGSIWTRWLKSLWQLCVGLIPEYIVLVLVLGAARAWLFPAIGPQATGVLWTVGLAVAGTLFVIPTAGEIPVVQTLMQFGLGVGPAAALLTTLPPVSLPSLVMLAKALPARVLLFVAGSVAGLGLLSAAVATLIGF